MKEIRFKALIYCGMYVDVNLLEKGIYISHKPCIYLKEDTIETIIAKARKIQDITNTGFISERYFENLKQCELMEIEIKEVKK